MVLLSVQSNVPTFSGYTLVHLPPVIVTRPESLTRPLATRHGDLGSLAASCNEFLHGHAFGDGEQPTLKQFERLIDFAKHKRPTALFAVSP